MRNFLTILALCFVLLASTSSVHAEIFDESKRSERLGLSFYDGRPMYYLYLARPNDRPHYPLYLTAERVQTGDDISDLPNYNKGVGYVIIQGADSKDFVVYGYNKDGKLEYLSNSGDPDASSWMQEALTLYGDSAIAQASSGDVGISAFDLISQGLRNWLLLSFGLGVAFFIVFYCWRLLTILVRGGRGVGLSFFALNRLNRYDNETASIVDDYPQTLRVPTPSDVSEVVDVSNADEFATGEAFGQKFSPKVVASNVDLQNEWARLSDGERAELLGDDFAGSPFGDRAYPSRQGNYYVDLERDNYYVDFTDEAGER